MNYSHYIASHFILTLHHVFSAVFNFSLRWQHISSQQPLQIQEKVLFWCWLMLSQRKCASEMYINSSIIAGCCDAQLHNHSKNISNHFNCTKDAWQMWQGIQAIANYKILTHVADDDTYSFLPEALNSFYAQFEVLNSMPWRKSTPPSVDQVHRT